MPVVVRKRVQNKKVVRVANCKQQCATITVHQAQKGAETRGGTEQQARSKQSFRIRGVVQVNVRVPVYRSSTDTYSCGLKGFGCYALGDTAEEAIQNLQETVHTALEVYEEEGMTLPPLPADYKPEDLEDPDFVSLLTLSVGVPKRLMAGGRAWLHSTPSASQHKVGSSSSDLLGKPCHSQL